MMDIETEYGWLRKIFTKDGVYISKAPPEWRSPLFRWYLVRCMNHARKAGRIDGR